MQNTGLLVQGFPPPFSTGWSTPLSGLSMLLGRMNQTVQFSFGPRPNPPASFLAPGNASLLISDYAIVGTRSSTFGGRVFADGTATCAGALNPPPASSLALALFC